MPVNLARVRLCWVAVGAGLVDGMHAAMALDLARLWDFGQPALSEQRFVAALADASPDDALVLRTQIARTYGLRKDFGQASALLRELEPQLRLEREREAAGLPSRYVFEELAILYRAQRDDERAQHYTERLRGLPPP